MKIRSHSILVSLFFAVLCSLLALTSRAQYIGYTTYGDGLHVIAEDSSFTMKFRVRFQTLYQGELDTRSGDYSDQFLIRRARIKFDGNILTPRLVYKVELAIANADTRAGAIPEAGNTSSIVLDALLKYRFAPHWTIWAGQTKLPGNRERVVSSQALQFVDRSHLNSVFNLDRDVGIQLLYATNYVNFIGAITKGEGRNIITSSGDGYDYTLRAEYLIFGKFTNKGDYFLSDLEREPTPKLSLGVTYDFNAKAKRLNGQLGSFVADSAHRDLSTWFVDAHFKYNGWSSLFEYANKSAPAGPVILDKNGNFSKAFYTGWGINWQAGYVFKNNIEIAARYTFVSPEKVTNRNNNAQYTIATSKYFSGHDFKVQSDLTLIKEAASANQLMFRLQFEFAL